MAFTRALQTVKLKVFPFRLDPYSEGRASIYDKSYFLWKSFDSFKWPLNTYFTSLQIILVFAGRTSQFSI